MSTETTTIPKVYAAINAVQALLAKDGITKGRKNQAQGYAFRGIDDIYNAIANFLAQEKLVIIPRCLTRTVTERETKAGGALFYVVVDVEFDFVSSIDGSKHTARMLGEAMDSGDKATNKAMSAAYKYACLQTFCIPTEADNDTENHTHEVASPTMPTIKPAAKQKADAKAKAARKPDPTLGTEVPWRDFAIHFGKNKGVFLGQLEQDNFDALVWYCREWLGPKTGEPSEQDIALRNALDRAMLELKIPAVVNPNA